MASDEVNLEDVYQLERFGSGPKIFFLLFYAPIGLALAIFRFFLAIQLLVIISILKKTWLFTRILLRVCCGVLGVVVTSEGYENLRRERIKIIVSNHVSMIDNVAMEIATPCITAPHSTSECLKFLESRFNDGTHGVEMKQDDFETKLPGILSTDSQVSFLAFPEETNSSEKSIGLLKFSTWPFGLQTTVVPTVITTKRLPFPPVYHSVIRSHWMSELFWFFFVPYTHFHIRFMPPISKEESQTNEQFCEQVEKAIASSLGVRTTKLTSVNKAIYALKLKREEELCQEAQRQTSLLNTSQRRTQPANSTSPVRNRNSRFTKMAEQVREVLPQVPLEDIKKDLGKTNCVDTTITNIIEGRVSYIPEDVSSTPSVSRQPTKPSPSPRKASNAASSFSPSSEVRQQSFEERKRNMIEEARRRYIAKHGL